MKKTKVKLTKHEAGVLQEDYLGTTSYTNLVLVVNNRTIEVDGSVTNGQEVEVDDELVGKTFVLKRLEGCDCKGMNPTIVITKPFDIMSMEQELIKLIEAHSPSDRIQMFDEENKSILYHINTYTLTYQE